MKFTYQLNKNIIYNLNITFIKLYFFRFLENTQITTVSNNNNKKKQLIELYIIIAILAAVIIIIMGGYALYRKYIEKNLQFKKQSKKIIIQKIQKILQKVVHYKKKNLIHIVLIIEKYQKINIQIVKLEAIMKLINPLISIMKKEWKE